MSVAGGQALAKVWGWTGRLNLSSGEGGRASNQGCSFRELISR